MEESFNITMKLQQQQLDGGLRVSSWPFSVEIVLKKENLGSSTSSLLVWCVFSGVVNSQLVSSQQPSPLNARARVRPGPLYRYRVYFSVGAVGKK